VRYATRAPASLDVTGFELDQDEATKAANRAKEVGLASKVHASDFPGWALRRPALAYFRKTSCLMLW
jgi:hypothetical protein